MKNRYYPFFLIILALIFLSGCQKKTEQKPVKDQSYQKEFETGPAKLTVKVNKTEITIAETLQLTLEMKIKKDYEVEFPELIEAANQFQLRDYKYNDPKVINKDEISVSKEYFLDPYLSGDYKIPPLTVYFWTTEEGKEKKHPLETEEIAIKVTSLLKEDYKNLIPKDIRGPLTPPSKLWLILLIAFISLLLIAGVVFYLWLRIKNREAKEKISRISAYQLAIDRLDNLVNQNLIEKNEIKEFYYTISTILREYIEDRFKLKAPEQTTEEFLENLKKNRALFNDQERSILIAFLNHCDIVKYAKHDPSQEEIQQTFNRCKEFIIATRDDNILIQVDIKENPL